MSSAASPGLVPPPNTVVRGAVRVLRATTSALNPAPVMRQPLAAFLGVRQALLLDGHRASTVVALFRDWPMIRKLDPEP